MGNNFIMSAELEDTLLEGPLSLSIERYTTFASQIAQEISAGLSVGKAYTLYTQYHVSSREMHELKNLKRALHTSFGDNGVRFQVSLKKVDERKDKIAVVIKRSQ